MESANQLEGPFKAAAHSCGACICGEDATSQVCSCQGNTVSFGKDGTPVEIRGVKNSMGQYRGW